MALTEVITPDKIEVVGDLRDVQVRTATIVYRDDVEIARSFHRHVVACQVWNVGSGEWEDPDLSGEYQAVQDICNSGIWTNEIKAAYREMNALPVEE